MATTQANEEARAAAMSMTAAPSSVSSFSMEKIQPQSGNFIADANARNARLETTIQGEISKIQSNPLEVDTQGLIGLINSTFERLSNRITESALASVKKSSIEMDAYFGSPTGDQRSGARVKMASNIKRNLMQGAYQAIASVYDKQTQDIINVSMEAAKVNTAVAGMKAQNITALIGEMNNAYMAVLSETNKNYGMQLEASLGWAQLQAETQYKYDALDFEYEKMFEQSRQFGQQIGIEKEKMSIQRDQFAKQLENDRYKFDTDLEFNKWKTNELLSWEKDQFGQQIGIEKEKMSIQRDQFAKQLENDRYKFDTDLEFNKWKTEELLDWDKDQFGQRFEIEKGKFEIEKEEWGFRRDDLQRRKEEIEKQQTEKMLSAIANPSAANAPMSSAQFLTKLSEVTYGFNGRFSASDDAMLKAAGWPDQERASRYLDLKKQEFDRKTEYSRNMTAARSGSWATPVRRDIF
jgi:hypothetical protein